MDNEKWLELAKNSGIDDKLKSYLSAVLLSLFKSNAPVIISHKHLAALLRISCQMLAKMSNASSHFYRNFTIPKRSGGDRTISSPYPLLRGCQEWIFHNILKNINTGEHAYAFVEGRSIKDHARIHLGARQLLKVDIKDFFGHVTTARVNSIFKHLGYTSQVSAILAGLCCHKGGLPQGACTSPIISNIVAKRLDRRFFALSTKIGLHYSRYADDMAFSGAYIPRNLVHFVDQVLISEGFEINTTKTVLKTGRQKKVITGISISSNDRLRVTKSYRRNFRKDVYFLLKNKIGEFYNQHKEFDPLYVDRMIGKVNFILNVDPSDEFATEAKKKLVALKHELFD